jgi:uncharacterized damage-inducible protein DinB
MSDATTISAMMKSTVTGPAWHGPSVMELLEGVTAEQALKHPLEECHSIWEIMFHLNEWQEYALDTIQGKKNNLKEGKDWPKPPADADESRWEMTMRRFEGCSREIREYIMHIDEARMHEMVPGKEFNLKVLLHGIIEHNIYHGGQLAILRKLV